MNEKKAIILCSGGLDSIVLFHYVRKVLDYKDIDIIFFDYHQNSIVQERKSVRYFARKIGATLIEINISDLSKLTNSLITEKKILEVKDSDLKNTKSISSNWYLPSRNTVFLSYALSYAESIHLKTDTCPDIFIGFKNEGEDFFPDSTPGYLKKMNELSNISLKKPIKILAPFIKKDKEDIISIGFKLGVELSKTYSCYSGTSLHCGVCLACKLRKKGFYWANTDDKTKYLK